MVSAVISYCNNDFRFIEENIRQCMLFSNDIIVVRCDKSLDGKHEDEKITQELRRVVNSCNALHPNVRISIRTIEFEPEKDSRHHHNAMRWSGVFNSNPKYDYILFLDADEIIEGYLFKEYLTNDCYENFDVYALRCYWYFRDRKYRAIQTEQAGVLCKKSICNYDYIFSPNERWAYANIIATLKVKENVTFKNQIMCHHYSWVRTKEEMLQKVTSWGHNRDKDWISLVEHEFSHEFNGTDFVHNYQYEILN